MIQMRPHKGHNLVYGLPSAVAGLLHAVGASASPFAFDASGLLHVPALGEHSTTVGLIIGLVLSPEVKFSNAKSNRIQYNF